MCNPFRKIARLRTAQFAALLLLGAVASCASEDRTPAARQANVTKAIAANVPVIVDYVGLTAAVESVEIRARVEGYLLERFFEDGRNVEQDELLFIIQPQQYRAEVEEAAGALERSEAELAYAREQVERYRPLAEQDYITRESFQETLTRARSLEASVAADRARLANAELALSYTEIASPIRGRIGRRQVDVGNLVGVGESTLLATVVQLDPIYLYFSPTDIDLPKLLDSHRRTPLVVRAILPGSREHKHLGVVDFIDNEVDSETATIQMRARIPNPEKTMLPGQFARAQLVLETIPNAVLVPQQALVENQGGFTAFVLGNNNEVEARTVKVGQIIDGMRVVTQGVKTGEKILINQLTRARSGMVVDPTVVSIDQAVPGFNNDATARPKTAAGR